jgi:hypothetical protein
MPLTNDEQALINAGRPTNDWTTLPNLATKKNGLSEDEQAFINAGQPFNDWTKPEAPPASEQLRNAPGLFATEARAQLHSLPSSTAEVWRFVGDKLQQFGEEQAAEQGREITPEERDLTDKIVNYIPDFIQELGYKYPKIFPTLEEARQQAHKAYKENTGEKLPEQPRGAIERAASGTGEASSLLAFPGSGAVKAVGIGTSAATKALDLSESERLGANVAIPVLVSVIESWLRKKYIPPKGLEELHAAGKELRMTDAELAPIFATEGQIKRHANFAQGVSKTEQAFVNTNEALGNVINRLHKRPQKFSTGDLVEQAGINKKIGNKLVTNLEEIQKDLLTGSHAQGEKTTTLADFIGRTIEDIEVNGTDPEKIIGTWREINTIGQGRNALARLKEPFLEAIKEFDPKLAEDLVNSNKLYARFMRNLKEVNPTQFNAFLEAGNVENLIGTIFSGDPKKATRGILGRIGKKAFQKISSEILINPKAQSLARNVGKAIRDGRKASAQAVAVQFKNFVEKELPEEFKEIDWKDLGF